MTESLISMAIQVARMDEERIINTSLWVTLKLLYDEMISENAIIPIGKINQDEKINYLKKAKNVSKEKWKIISICQALYLKNLISNK